MDVRAKRATGSASERLSAAGLRSFFRIADAWSLNVSEQRAALGNIARQTLYNWRDHPESARLSDDQLDRISYMLGVYKALHILFTRPEQADSWIRRPNDALPFGGKPAAHILFSGRMEDMMRVRRYLDGQRSAW
jgi:uncharacterized protein (DUF2384 family)